MASQEPFLPPQAQLCFGFGFPLARRQGTCFMVYSDGWAIHPSFPIWAVYWVFLLQEVLLPHTNPWGHPESLYFTPCSSPFRGSAIPLCLLWKVYGGVGAVSCYTAIHHRCYVKKKGAGGIFTLSASAIYLIYSITDALKSPESTHVLQASLGGHRELFLLTCSF